MFFKSDYHDLLPPESETGGALPEKTGARRLFELLALNCGAILKTNLLFLLFCVPVVTIPLSIFALNRAMLRIALDQPVKCFQIYTETFRRYWKQSCLAFLLTAVPLVCGGYGMWFYITRVASAPLLFLPFLVCSTIFLAALLSSGCLYGLLAGGRTLKEALRLAPLLGIARPQRTVPAALLGYGFLSVGVLAFPISGMYLLLIGFSFPCFLGNFFLRVILSPYLA